MFLQNLEAIRTDLETELGERNVLSKDFILSSYIKDGTLFYYPLSKPSVVVLPESTEDVQKIIRIANQYKVPVVASAGRTNSWGGVDSNQGIAVDMCHLNKVIDIDERNLTFTVQAGVNVHHMNRDLDKMGYRYPTHPLNNAAISFGSEVCKNTGGEVGCMYGHAAKRIIGLKVVLGNGEIIETGSCRVIQNLPYYQQSGIPDLTQLFVAAEGAYGIITEVTMAMQSAPVAHIGLDIKFEGNSHGFKKIVNAVHEMRVKKLISNAHLIDFYTMWMLERGIAGKGVEVDEEATREKYGHILVLEIESFYTQEECEIRKKGALEICRKYGGEYVGDNMAKGFSHNPNERGEDAIKYLFSESSPMVPFWADVSYDNIPIFYDKALALMDENGWPRKKSCFIVAMGDESCLSFYFTYPNPHDEKDVQHSIDVNKKILKLYTEIGVIPYRIGRMWRPYIMNKLDPKYLQYIRRIKKLFDPNNIVNPGVSVFEEVAE